MGLFSDLIGAAVKVAVTPVAVVKDVVNVATGQEADSTKSLLESVGKDLESAVDHATGEK